MPRAARWRLRRNGLALTEVLFILVILGVVVVMVLPNLMGRQGKTINHTLASIAGFENACKMYAASNNGDLPHGSAEEVVRLLVNPGQDESGRRISPYLEKPPKDEWGQLLFYEFPSRKFADPVKPAIWSSGLNKINEDGGGDDVRNW